MTSHWFLNKDQTPYHSLPRLSQSDMVFPFSLSPTILTACLGSFFLFLDPVRIIGYVNPLAWNSLYQIFIWLAPCPSDLNSFVSSLVGVLCWPSLKQLPHCSLLHRVVLFSSLHISHYGNLLPTLSISFTELYEIRELSQPFSCYIPSV